MTERTLKRLLVALAALLVVYVATRAASAVARPGTGGGPLGTALEQVRRDSLAGLLAISPSGQRMELRRDGASWTVNGFRADSAAVDRLVRATAELAVVDLVARSPETHARLGVSADSAWRVELRGRRDTVSLLLGGTGREYANGYVRLPDAAEVYEVRGGLRGAVTIAPDDWRDRMIVRLDSAAVRTVAIARDGGRYALVRADSGWRLGDGGADPVRVTDLLSELTRFAATGFEADSAAFQGRDLRRVVALGQAGDTLASVELRGDSATWLARVPGRPTLFRVSSYSVDRLTPSRQQATARR